MFIGVVPTTFCSFMPPAAPQSAQSRSGAGRFQSDICWTISADRELGMTDLASFVLPGTGR